MFLIRTAFWLTLIILLLPTNEEQQRQVYGTAEATVKDLKTFCTRNPEVCEKSREAFEIFSQKAKFGARMLMDFVTDASADESATLDAVKARHVPSFFRRSPQNTLTAEDMQPPWSGPKDRSGV